jgi:hypothetical protein
LPDIEGADKAEDEIVTLMLMIDNKYCNIFDDARYDQGTMFSNHNKY